MPCLSQASIIGTKQAFSNSLPVSYMNTYMIIILQESDLEFSFLH